MSRYCAVLLSAAVAACAAFSAVAAEESGAGVTSDRYRIDTRVFRLEHASAAEVAEKLNEMWNGEFGQKWKVTKMAVPFQESNSVMVTAPEPVLEACERAIAELDVEARQVYIEARFVELGNTASHRVGIDWTMLGGMTGTATLGGGIQSYNVGKGVQNYTRTVSSKTDGTMSYSLAGSDSVSDNKRVLGSEDGTISYFNGTLNFSQMSLTLKALDATEDARTFSNPKIIVSSGKKAVVDMTTKYPNVKVAAKRTEASGSTSLDIASNIEAIPGEDKLMFAKEAFFSWGISLEVTPRISTNGLINVSIVPTISSQSDWVETGTSSSDEDSGTISSRYPVIEVQRLVTEFSLESGATAVIGGLSVTKERQVDNGIPLLREIPWFGPRLFGSMERVKEQKEIIVFVTVGLVNPRNVDRDVGLPKNAVLGRQYIKRQKLEPGDREEKNMEGFNALDLRLLEDQAKDPLRIQQPQNFSFGDYVPFRKEKEKKENGND
ncbi:MAG: hypothetical protein IJH50_07810 [Kiritimatiellae bacterium]|nr:hypothetical protein [Kiritimatiellia bacterium]